MAPVRQPYNAGMLRRTSKLLALLFLVGMAFLTFAAAGHPTAAPDRAAHQPVQALVELTHSQQGVGLFNGAQVRGLADIQPELPDVLSLPMRLVDLTLAPPESVGTACAKPASLALETLLRPPRGTALT